MTRRAALACMTVYSLLLPACALFDSGTPWHKGRFALQWIDSPDEVKLCYDTGNGGWLVIIPARVFAVGSDERYVVAQQHPAGDRAITNYFILDVRAYVPRDRSGVVGPLTAKEFEAKASDLKLPAFTTVLESLR